MCYQDLKFSNSLWLLSKWLHYGFQCTILEFMVTPVTCVIYLLMHDLLCIQSAMIYDCLTPTSIDGKCSHLLLVSGRIVQSALSSGFQIIPELVRSSNINLAAAWQAKCVQMCGVKILSVTTLFAFASHCCTLSETNWKLTGFIWL